MAQYGKTSLSKLVGVHPDLVTVMNEAIKDTPIDYSLIFGVRTTKMQQDLYAQGRTKKGNIVTKADGVKNKSNHQIKEDGFGWAVDFCPLIEGKLDWNTHANFKAIADHIVATGKRLGIKVVSGYYWKFFDAPHIQLG